MNIMHNIIWVAIVFLCNTACTVNTIKKDIESFKKKDSLNNIRFFEDIGQGL